MSGHDSIIKDGDILYHNHPRTGAEDCTCSRCGYTIKEYAVRINPMLENDQPNLRKEWRYHQKCAV